MPRTVPNGRKTTEDKTAYLREHLYEIRDAEEFYGVIGHARHACYDLEQLIETFAETSFVDAKFVSLVDDATALTEQWRDLESGDFRTNADDAIVTRTYEEIEDFDSFIKQRLILWQRMERCLATMYDHIIEVNSELLSDGGSRAIKPVSQVIELLLLSVGDQIDPMPRRVTYVFGFDPDDPTDELEVSIQDYSRIRQRSELQAKQVLRAVAEHANAVRETNSTMTLNRMTNVLVWLTIVLIILAVMQIGVAVTQFLT